MQSAVNPNQIRSLAEYAARLVRERKHDELGTGQFLRWYNPFYDRKWDQDPKQSTEDGYFNYYPEAERILRKVDDPYCQKLVRCLDSTESSHIKTRKTFARYIEDADRRVPEVVDHQKIKVYRAEWKVRNTDQIIPKEEVEAFINKVATSKWWSDRSGHGTEDIDVIHRVAKKAWARPESRLVKLAGEWSWRKSVALHELAHLLAPPDEWHGPIFCALFVMLCREFLSDTFANALIEQYIANHVKVATGQTISAMLDARMQHGYSKVTHKSLIAANAIQIVATR